MNTLSWFIYFIGLIGSANTVLALFVLMILPMLIIMRVTIDVSGNIEYEKFRSYISVRKLIMIWSILLTLLVVLPSRNTLILIAASEYSERLVNDPKVQGIIDPSLDLLKIWVEKEKESILGKVRHSKEEK